MTNYVRVLVVSATLTLAIVVASATSTFGACGPFADVSDAALCPFVLEIFYLGITTGTTSTTFDPASNVSRLQMAAFLSRSVDSVLRRGSRRAALGQFSMPQSILALGLTTVGIYPRLVACDGADVWVANLNSGSISRVRGSDGRLLETWTGAPSAHGVLVAMGRVFVAANSNPGALYRIDPSEGAGVVTTVASNLVPFPIDLAFDGSRIWIGNAGIPGAVSIVTPGPTIPWTVTTITSGFTRPQEVVYDGSNVWAVDAIDGLFKLDASGAILQTVTLGPSNNAIFDGSNLWVLGPNVIIRASTGAVLQTFTGNGPVGGYSAAFDGERILIASPFSDSVKIWKAADATPLGSFPTGAGTQPFGVCSDGINFWVSLTNVNKLARF